MSVQHYENFPVASVLCPPRIRPAVVAIYHFARTADDLADEGDAPPQQRMQDLGRYRDDLLAIYKGRPTQGPWGQVFANLDRVRQEFDLPFRPLDDLLDAFIQDTANPLYEDRQALLHYCARSANPVGRLLMHLYGIDNAQDLRRSDAICSALQLINFWQDLSVDLPRGRIYLPRTDASRHDVPLDRPAQLTDQAATRELVRELCTWAEELMWSGAPLAQSVPGRAGWELRLVVQGGLRILDKIRSLGWGTIAQRPKLNALDLPVLLWRSAHMRPAHNPVGGLL